MRYWLLGRGYDSAAEAMEFASKYHVGLRKDGLTPEFAHQISIAHYIRTLPDLMYPEETLTTIFLHDVVEDYNVPLAELTGRFGPKVSEATALLSKQVSGHVKSTDDYYHAMIINPIASIVKGGDRIHNFQTMLTVFSKEKQKKYIRECETYILPMMKASRRSFPRQEMAYENIKHLLNSQIALIHATMVAEDEA